MNGKREMNDTGKTQINIALREKATEELGKRREDLLKLPLDRDIIEMSGMYNDMKEIHQWLMNHELDPADADALLREDEPLFRIYTYYKHTQKQAIQEAARKCAYTCRKERTRKNTRRKKQEEKTVS